MAVRSLSLYQKVQLVAAEPLEWKASEYVQAYKGHGLPQQAENYRDIVLSPVMAKCHHRYLRLRLD
eukprot:8406792-Prorocentrum_lima.AAC.1